ncbi:MAG: hemerythrin family protein [Betaproteobacteria bacterium]|nr:hemerythrin family protein [Betaproteobacteria bacterium]
MHNDHFPWKPEFDLGIREIDDQHHHFVGLINKFIVELWGQDNIEYQRMLVAELIAYARFHFISEENLMFRIGYPELAGHKLHHRELLDQLNAKQARLMLDHTEQRKKDVVSYLVEWFTHHTAKEDRLIADYMHRSDPAEAPA